ncbi:MAG: type II secretion system F family protein [Acidimicrobiales bacterium]
MTMDPITILAVGMTAIGLGAAWVGALRTRPVGPPNAADYLRTLDDSFDEPIDEYQKKLQEPPLQRLLRPLGSAAGTKVGSITPRAQLDRIHSQLLQAGMGGTIRAEELATLEVIMVAGAALFGMFVTLTVQPRLAFAVLLVLGLPFFALLAPQAWLTRQVDDRKDAIRGDLPDALDLLAIAVEAGTGFEGAIGVVCANFDTPLGHEFSRLLKEMELGLSRREALQNLKRRTEVPELSNFVLALVQADALGMPIGRVLKTQAVEMRNKRRAWAREKAAKLPVKMMLPLVFFIFPAILIVTLGPAVSTVAGGFK